MLGVFTSLLLICVIFSFIIKYVIEYWPIALLILLISLYYNRKNIFSFFATQFGIEIWIFLTAVLLFALCYFLYIENNSHSKKSGVFKKVTQNLNDEVVDQKLADVLSENKWLLDEIEFLKNRNIELNEVITKHSVTVGELKSQIKKLSIDENLLVNTRKTLKQVNNTNYKNLFSDFDLYDTNPKQAIKNFVNEIYERDYEGVKNSNEWASNKGKDFELFIGKIYELSGYDVIYNGIETHKKRGTDYGADLIAEKDGHKIAIQCKHIAKDGKLPFNVSKDYYTSVAKYNVDEFIIYSTVQKISRPLKKELFENKKIILRNNWKNLLFNHLNKVAPKLFEELNITQKDFKSLI